MDSETKTMLSFFTLAVIVFVLILGVIMGPAGCQRQMSAWKAGAYGSNWLVVQYAQDGHVINYWELKNKSIGNEQNSDGIYFPDNEDNVVHLSGHYVYIQTNDFDRAKELYLK